MVFSLCTSLCTIDLHAIVQLALDSLKGVWAAEQEARDAAEEGDVLLGILDHAVFDVDLK